MLTRRNALAGAFAMRAIFAKASQPTTPLNFEVPAHACDCHTHIFGDSSKFPFFAGRSYTPETALPEEMSALHRALRIERVVIVTPSVYGADNSTTLYGIKARGASARGIAVIDDKTSNRDLNAMDKAGIRGIRLNLATSGQTDPAIGRQRFQAAARRVKSRRWHIQMFTSLAVIAGIKDLVVDSPVPVVFDHFGGAQLASGINQPGFINLVELVRTGKAYVKISLSGPNLGLYAEAAPFARALIGANADRVIWGTDWPHPNTTSGKKLTEVSPLHPIDDGLVLNQLAIWAPDTAVRKKILVDNPAKLYGF